MNSLIKTLKDKRGGTLIMITVLIMASILTVSLSLASVVVNGLKVSKNQANATQAYFAAESGAEKFLWEMRKNAFDPIIDGCTNINKYVLINFLGCGATIDNTTKTTQTNGTKFYIDYNLNGATTTVSNYGEYRGTRRAVKLQY